MEQTIAQIGTLEQQINAIESANINRETLAAMEKAGDAMKHIHGKLTPQKVDETMYVILLTWEVYSLMGANYVPRDKLRDQNALSEEIVQAITGNSLGEPVDDVELEDELEQLQQEHLDEQMLKTGNVPVSDAVHKMPSPAQAERKLIVPCSEIKHGLLTRTSCIKQETGSGGRRRSRVGEAASRNGHVRLGHDSEGGTVRIQIWSAR